MCATVCWVCMRNRAVCLATFGTASAIDANWIGVVAIGGIYRTITSDGQCLIMAFMGIMGNHPMRSAFISLPFGVPRYGKGSVAISIFPEMAGIAWPKCDNLANMSCLGCCSCSNIVSAKYCTCWQLFECNGG